MDEWTFLESAPAPLLLSAALTLVLIPLRQTPFIRPWLIPYISFLLGSVGYCFLEGFTFRNHLLGLVLGGCAVGLHQSFKQGQIGFREMFSEKPAVKAAKD